MEHTKGEWKATSAERKGDWIIREVNTQTLIGHVVDDDVDVDMEQSEANAKLIAAAPELLEALTNLISKCNILPNSHCPEGESPFGDAMQAIKKATE